MNKNIILEPHALKLYTDITNLQKDYFDTNKNTLFISSPTITHHKLLGTSFLTNKQIQKLRKQYDSEIISTVLTQLDLQKTAFVKHGNATQNLLFLRTSLEQSTRYKIAVLHAERFIKSQANKIADLGCGIGIDSFAIAEKTQKQTNKTTLPEIISYELDKQIFEIAQYNLSSFKNCEVKNSNIENINFHEEKFEAIYSDPARRKNGKRIHNPNQWSPSLNTIYTWLENCSNIGAKLAPGIDYKFLHPDSETNWLSINGELIEATIWFGKLKNHTGKTATIIKTDKENNILFNKTIICDNNSTQEPSIIDCTNLPIQNNIYLFEIDPALLRANGLSIMAKKLDAKLISENISYLISDKQCDDLALFPLIQQWEIIDHCTLKSKKINEMLNKHSIGNLEIKKRGTDITPETLRKSLKLKGKEKSTLFLTRYKGKHTAILAKEINSSLP